MKKFREEKVREGGFHRGGSPEGKFSDRGRGGEVQAEKSPKMVKVRVRKSLRGGGKFKGRKGGGGSSTGEKSDEGKFQEEGNSEGGKVRGEKL